MPDAGVVADPHAILDHTSVAEPAPLVDHHLVEEQAAFADHHVGRLASTRLQIGARAAQARLLHTPQYAALADYRARRDSHRRPRNYPDISPYYCRLNHDTVTAIASSSRPRLSNP